jgi:hypothetical protein
MADDCTEGDGLERLHRDAHGRAVAELLGRTFDQRR